MALPTLLLARLGAGNQLLGSFDISNIDGTYQGNDEDGFSTTGTLVVGSAGNVDWTGDTLGTSEGDDWWVPNNTVQGTWHVKLVHDSGTNQRSGGTALNTWTAVGSFSMSFLKGSNGGPDDTVGNYTLSFSDDGGSSTHDSVAIAITLFEQSP